MSSERSDVCMVNFDYGRMSRMGFGETVLAEGKTLRDLVEILQAVLEKNAPLLVTRLSASVYQTVLEALPHLAETCHYNEHAGVLRSHREVSLPSPGETPLFKVAIVTAGTSDRCVAEESLETLMHHQIPCTLFGDVGVSGLHRILNIQEKVQAADCVICIAGMDGALASVVGGLFKVPILAVPTSTGYGASGQGQAALSSMLATCANGLSVMNIDNGYGAAMAAVRLRNMLFLKLEDDRGRKILN